MGVFLLYSPISLILSLRPPSTFHVNLIKDPNSPPPPHHHHPYPLLVIVSIEIERQMPWALPCFIREINSGYNKQKGMCREPITKMPHGLDKVTHTHTQTHTHTHTMAFNTADELHYRLHDCPATTEQPQFESRYKSEKSHQSSSDREREREKGDLVLILQGHWRHLAAHRRRHRRRYWQVPPF